MSAGIPQAHFVETMGAMELGNDRTYELLELILTRIARLEEHVKRSEVRSALAAQPNMPVDPDYVNHVLAANQKKIEEYLPMKSDAMVFAFDRLLCASAESANDAGAPDRVCFLPVLVIDILTVLRSV
jgi:hypothetical protein